jgi:integrase
MAISGVLIHAIAKLMRHATIQMSMRYAHLSPDFNQPAVDKLMDFNNRQATISAIGKT